MKLWQIANQCARFQKVSRSVLVENMPDGTVVKTIYVFCSGFDPGNAIRAIAELNKMDGDYSCAGNCRLLRR